MGPKPFQGEANFADRPVIQREACAKWIAAIAAEWSRIESIIATFYSTLIFGQRDFYDEGEWIVMEAFENLLSFRMKRDFLLNAARQRFADEEIEKLESLLKRIQKAGERRNDIIHGRWAIGENTTTGLVWIKPITNFNNKMLYEETDFIEILERMEKSASDLEDFFFEELAPKLKVIAQDFVERILAAQNTQDAP